MQRIIIVGAGPAGLTAAHSLLKESKEYEVILLEESNEIGGISKTVNYKGNRMDIGGHRFFSKNEAVMKWWEERLPLQGALAYDDRLLNRHKNLQEGGPDPQQVDKVMLTRDRVSRIYYNKKFFDYPIRLKLRTFLNMGLIKTVQVGFSYLKSCVVKKPEDSLENFYINRFGRALYGMFFEKYTEKLWGRHPNQISADWGAQRVKGLSIIAILKDIIRKIHKNNNAQVETSLIEEFIYPKYGPGQLWDQVAHEIESMGGTIIKNAKVETFQFAGEKIHQVSYRSMDGSLQQMEGDIIISTMPVKDLIEGFDTSIPEHIVHIAHGLPYRDFVTVGLLLSSWNLKNDTNMASLKDMVPDCWIYVQDADVKLGRIQVFNNWSPYMVQDIEHTIWIGLEYFCNEHDEFWNMNEEDCVDHAIHELIQMGIIDSKEQVIDSHREKMKKAYPAYFDTYNEMNQLIDYLNSIDNLYCIGRNGQHHYNNMDHSMLTAFEAVNNIINGKTTKDNIWNVNVEKEYHEATTEREREL